MKTLCSAATLAFLVGTSTPALAQEAPSDWQVSLTPYLWVSGYSGEVTGLPNRPPTETNVNFGNLLENLSGAFIGKAEVRYRRVGAYADTVFLKLSKDGVTDQGLVSLNSEAELTTATATAAGYYRAYTSDNLSVDLMGGVRYVKLELEVDLAPTGAGGPGVSRNVSQSLTTPIIGIRATPRIGPRSTLTGYADYGGFESDTATVWQLYATYNYQWTPNVAVSAGYRHYAIEMNKGEVEADIALSGPIFAFTYTF